ncbi:hypothetical protein [Sphingomonas sp. RIT328]|uniref:hypothetical protein n=1 Tax=Sphingomonas sp. RIT328 TaxID=1470591 RepID=UPI000448B084|nr:hypothetical protein [Sphingomonas sp. RIT328]EZP53241.1 hypothetical protein BW41_02037 [Sphingomonas sp. RIT328]
MPRYLPSLSLVALLAAAAWRVEAAPAQFDLVGPRLDVAVTHNGATLPLAWVPNLSEGDRISIKLDSPPAGTEKFRIVASFLRGAVERPPHDWFFDTLAGKRHDKQDGGTLSLIVPKGAQQLALFILPAKGGSSDAVASAVRKQPGAFVRAVQDLNQATLDRARLDTFLNVLLEAERQDPSSVSATSQILTRSLSIKLKAECLQQPVELQAACLTGDRETLLFADTHSSALADTLAGAPTDLAFQLSATPQAGYGSYSSYIGVVRDIFRLFGAFQSTQLQFVPALARMDDSRLTLLLNTPLSFAKPASVMVVGLPAIEAAKPPPLRKGEDVGLVCASAGSVLPVEGAPLVYATRYARDVRIRATGSGGTTFDLPAHADPRRGGYVLDQSLPAAGFTGAVAGQLRGNWGFTAFDGPRFRLSRPMANQWSAPSDASLVVGRTNTLALAGEGGGCVTGVTMRRGDGAPQPLTWKQDGERGLLVDVPLDKAAPGTVTLTVQGAAGAAPATLSLPALQEIGRLDALTLSAGDDNALLSGSRLDQVREVRLGSVLLRPGALTRSDRADQLVLAPADPAALRALPAGERLTAEVRFVGDRRKTIAVTVAPARPLPVILHKSVAPAVHAGVLPVTLSPDDRIAQDARFTFAFRLDPATPLTGQETIEIAAGENGATARLTIGKGYDLQDAATGIVSFVPGEALGGVAHGPLRVRILRDGSATRWAPLGSVVRLPEVRGIACSGTRCTVSGDRLFLAQAIATDATFTTAQPIPDGFTATAVDLPAPGGQKPAQLFIRLRDMPDSVAAVAVP